LERCLRSISIDVCPNSFEWRIGIVVVSPPVAVSTFE
jgi:hypothetical protein